MSGKGIRLNESQRLEIIANFIIPTPCKKSLAKEYEVCESAILHLGELGSCLKQGCGSGSGSWKRKRKRENSTASAST